MFGIALAGAEKTQNSEVAAQYGQDDPIMGILWWYHKLGNKPGAPTSVHPL